MSRVLDTRTVRAIQLRAFDRGGRLQPFSDGSSSRTVHWDVSGNCLSPVTVELHGRKERRNERMITVSKDPSSRPNFVQMEVACRKCENCLRRKSYMWRMRAMHEWRIAPRTWLATFTLSPEALVSLLSRARVAAAKRGDDFDALPGADREFLGIEAEGYKDLQLWMKRLRKNSGKRFRYLLVAEAHKSGVPHWHMLLHEVDKPLSYDKDLKGTWPNGFDAFKLVRDAPAAGYVTKYLGKSIAARVRASIAYGGPVVPALPPIEEAEWSAAQPSRNERERGLPKQNTIP